MVRFRFTPVNAALWPRSIPVRVTGALGCLGYFSIAPVLPIARIGLSLALNPRIFGIDFRSLGHERPPKSGGKVPSLSQRAAPAGFFLSFLVGVERPPEEGQSKPRSSEQPKRSGCGSSASPSVVEVLAVPCGRRVLCLAGGAGRW